MASPIISNKEIEVSKLFIDGVEIKVYPGNLRRAHGDEGNGYQRDPYKRIKWLTARSKKFKRSLLRTIEVSPRDDGTYAIIDGGGRWVMAQLAKVTTLQCRVHHNLTREEEAQLFHDFDREIYRLRGIDSFLALMGAGDVTANLIAQTVEPFRIAVSGRNTIKCVGQFMATMHTPHGQRVLSTTAKLIAKNWCGYDEKSKAFQSGKSASIDGLLFMSVALVVDAVNEAIEDEGWDTSAEKDYKGYLDEVLAKTSAADVVAHLKKNYATEKTVPATLIAAKWLAKKTRAYAIKDDNETLSDGMVAGRLFEAYSEPRTYGNRMDAERKAAEKVATVKSSKGKKKAAPVAADHAEA